MTHRNDGKGTGKGQLGRPRRGSAAFAVLTLDVPVLVAAIMTLSTNFVITGVEIARRRSAEALPAPVQVRELVGVEA